MVIEYKCPKCGSRVIETVLPTYPPQRKFECSNPECDYTCVIREKMIVGKAPVEEVKEKETEGYYYLHWSCPVCGGVNNTYLGVKEGKELTISFKTGEHGIEKQWLAFRCKCGAEVRFWVEKEAGDED